MATVNCPNCDFEIFIPDDCKKGHGKCPSCLKELSVEELLENNSIDKDVLDWIGDAKPTAPATPIELPKTQTVAAVKTQPAEEIIKAEPVFVPGDRKFNVKFEHVDEMGAFFMFPSSLLDDPDFRSCMPQHCIICGNKQDLTVNLITWPTKHSGSRSDPQTTHSPCVFKLSDFKEKSPRELVEQLPNIQNQSPPWSHPFPYYVCSHCSPVGALFTDVQLASGMCELGFSSLRRAYDFACLVCGKDSPTAKKVLIAIKENAHRQAWRQLPLAVRNRINKWFQIQEDETFVCYISDAEFSKAEAGLAGIVITDNRLVYHKSLSQAQFNIKDKIEVAVTEGKNGQLKLSISSPDGHVKGFTATKATLKQLQHYLADANPKTLSV